jgi:glycosyltransferase involved in cell wall biosynthesis
VLVAAWDEAEMIAEHIASFAALRYPHKEFILCAGGDDGTLRMAREHEGEGVRVLEQVAGEGKQRSLQRCLAQASGEIIFLTDADCLLDDDSFERTLQPLLCGGEQVATGASRPLARQLHHPFVIHQWCTDLYVQARQPQWSTGLLGRNCALRRDVLEGVGGFAAEVRTGTDYYLAKLVLQAGRRIRYVRDSAVATRYPETFASYWRRQSRWVRNLLLHGPAFGDQQLIRAAQSTTAIGLALLVLPLGGALAGALGARSAAGWLLAVWSVALWHTFLARLRYIGFARLYRGLPVSWPVYALLPLHMFVDFVAWVAPLADRIWRPQQW